MTRIITFDNITPLSQQHVAFGVSEPENDQQNKNNRSFSMKELLL
jgi:hypothetical protein